MQKNKFFVSGHSFLKNIHPEKSERDFLRFPPDKIKSFY